MRGQELRDLLFHAGGGNDLGRQNRKSSQELHPVDGYARLSQDRGSRVG